MDIVIVDVETTISFLFVILFEEQTNKIFELVIAINLTNGDLKLIS